MTDTKTPGMVAAIEASGIAEADVVKITATPDGPGVHTAKNHAVVDPGDALPVAVQRGVACDWEARGEPAPLAARGRG